MLTTNINHINNELTSIDDIANRNIFSSNEDNNDLREIRSTAGYDQTNELLSSAESNNVDLARKESQRSDNDEVERIFDDDYSSEEDYAVETDGIKVARKNAIRLHTSYQKTSVREPLLQQGFIASPGYPSYYVGSSNCSWFITAPKGQRIRLTILDINLRCKFSYLKKENQQFDFSKNYFTVDQPCVDIVEVLDIINQEVIFSSCLEMSKPFEVLSYSSEIKVISIGKKRSMRNMLIYFVLLI